MDIVSYFIDKTGLTPTPEQEQILLDIADPNKRNILEDCGRGLGKTLITGIALLWFAENEEYSNLELRVVSTLTEMYTKLDRVFIDHPELKEKLRIPGHSKEIPYEEFEFITTHSRVSRQIATEKNVRSKRSNVLVLDEAQLMKDDVIQAAMGCRIEPLSKLIIIGTPSDKPSKFNEILETPEKFGFEVHQYPSDKLPWNEKAAKDFLKMWGKAAYAREYLARPPTEKERTLFSSPNITKCLYKEVIREGGQRSKIHVGIDWGFNPASTVLTVTEHIGARRRVLYIKAWKNKPQEVMHPEIEEICARWKPDVIKADSRPEPYKEYFSTHSNLSFNWIDGRIHKESMIGQIKRTISQHTLEIDETQQNLIRQLRKYKRNMDYGDDYVDSLMISAYEPSIPLKERKPVGHIYW